MKSMFSRLVKASRIAGQNNHNGLKTFFIGMLLIILRGITRFFMVLDNLIFPGLRTKRSSAPFVISGNPRTGTTFLQRFLEKQGAGCGSTLSLLAAPSLCIQKMIRPLLVRIEKRSPVKHYDRDIHETGLTRAEADDLAIVFRYLDGVFFFSYFLSFSKEDLSKKMMDRLRGRARRDFRWLEKVWRRSLYLNRAEQNLVKMFFLPLCVPEFQKKFPDGRILYIVRDPLEYLPSTVNLMRSVMEKTHNFADKTNEDISRWVNNLYSAFLNLQSCFYRDWSENRLDKKKIYLLKYSRLTDDFEKLMAEIAAFLDFPAGAEFQEAVRAQAELQKSFIPEQLKPLDAYGISTQQIKKDFAFYYSEFLS